MLDLVSSIQINIEEVKRSPTLTQDWNPVNQSCPWFTESCCSAFSAKSFHSWVDLKGVNRVLKVNWR